MAIPRAAWTSSRPSFAQDGPKRELFIHHTVSPNREWSRAQEREHLRQIEAQHQNQGWSGIGYSYVVFPSGRLYVARGASYIPAAQLNHNTGTVAISYAGNLELAPPTEAAVKRIVRAAKALRRNRGITSVGGHRDVYATACPGKHLYSKLDRIAREAKLRRV